MTDPIGDVAREAALREAISAHQQGRLEEASACYAKVLAADPQNTQALRLHGVLARQQGDFPTSIRLLRAVLEFAPEDVTAANDLALSFMACGDLHAAEIALRGALGIAPDSSRALANLGALLQQRGHLAEAISVHRHYLELQPDDLEVQCNLANALMDAGHDEESLETCDAALSRAPDHPLVMANKGAVLCGLHRYVAAVEILEQALAANPDDDMALVNLAFAHRALGDDKAAIELLTRATRLSPDNTRASADLANALLASGQLDHALGVCERFLAAYPGERLVLATYAYVLLEAGHRAESRRILDYRHLVRVHDIDVPEGFTDLEEFNRELEGFIASHPSLVDDPVLKATTGGAQTGELSPLESPEFGALNAIIQRAIEATVGELSAAGFGNHEVMAYAADQWGLRTWGTVLSAGGCQSPHQHPLGWLSGVYYVCLPVGAASSRDSRAHQSRLEAAPTVGSTRRSPPMGSTRQSPRPAGQRQGTLEFGFPPARIRMTSEPEVFSVEPRPGRLVIFPSWFYHRTLPFNSPGKRVSIAFDVMPRG